MSDTSEYYETVTKTILENLRDQLGINRVCGKTKYPGASGTEWEIDASCYRAGTNTLVLVECRRKTTSKVKQEEVAGFAYRVMDVGAAEGLMVTPIGLQEGAEKVAKAERIGIATLNPDATESEYIFNIAGQLFRGLLSTDIGVATESCFVQRICGCGSELLTHNDGQTFSCPKCDS